jgi:hypothetical protein
MSSEKLTIDPSDNEYGISLTSDQAGHLFDSSDEDDTSSMSSSTTTEESAPVQVDSQDTATAEIESQEQAEPEQTTQPEQESPTTEVQTESEEDEYVFELDGQEYDADELAQAVESLNNRNDWQRSNTQKSQDVAQERKSFDKIVESLNSVIDGDMKEYLGEDHELFKQLSNYGELSQTEDVIAEEVTPDSESTDRVEQLETRLLQMEARNQVESDVQELVVKHPELGNNDSALNSVLHTALDKGLDLEDAYVFASATANDESVLSQAVKQVEEANRLKKQPEVTKTTKGSRDTPIPIADDFDAISKIALDGHYSLFKNE